MNLQVLNSRQQRLLGTISGFSLRFYLAGGTAAALQIGHRRSLDFDLFSKQEIDPDLLMNSLARQKVRVDDVLARSADEFTLVVDSVKLSFIFYPYPIRHDLWLDNIITMPDLLSIAAMKAYALGRRARWKDYVDLFMIFQNYYSLSMVTAMARKVFQGAFNERLFREQLCYFDDVDFTEEIDFMLDRPPDNHAIMSFLIQVATGRE